MSHGYWVNQYIPECYTSSDVAQWSKHFLISIHSRYYGGSSPCKNALWDTDNSRFVTVSHSTLLASDDGASWSILKSLPFDIYYIAPQAAEIYVVTTRFADTIAYFAEHTKVKTIGLPTSNIIQSIAYNGSLFVAVGDSGTILTSPYAPNLVGVTYHGRTAVSSPYFRVANMTVHYTVPATDAVSIYLYDLRGRLVHTLLNSRVNAGTYTAALPQGLAQGRYIVMYRAGSYQCAQPVVIVQ